jgi:hypothetical protein
MMYERKRKYPALPTGRGLGSTVLASRSYGEKQHALIMVLLLMLFCMSILILLFVGCSVMGTATGTELSVLFFSSSLLSLAYQYNCICASALFRGKRIDCNIILCYQKVATPFFSLQNCRGCQSQILNPKTRPINPNPRDSFHYANVLSWGFSSNPLLIT